MKNRRKSRELALQALYQVDVARASADDALRAALGAEEEPVEEEIRAFAESLVRGVAAELESIDAVLQRHSLHWKVERMAKIDRNVMRMAIHELRGTDTPGKVVLNEAVELGKAYGSTESSAFINAILDKVALELGRR